MLDEYVRMNRKYFLHPVNIILLLVLMGLTMLAMANAGGIFSSFWERDMFRGIYQDNLIKDSIMILKFAIVIFSVFLSLQFNTKTHDNLAIYSVQNRKERFLFIIARLRIIIASMSLVVISLSLFLAICLKYLVVAEIDYFWLGKLVIAILLNGISYLMIVGLLMSIIRSFVIALVPVILFFLMETNQNAVSGFTKILYDLFPFVKLIDNEIVLQNPILMYLVYISVLGSSVVLIYLKKDLN